MKNVICKVSESGRFTEGKFYKVDAQYENVIVISDDSTAVSHMMHHLKTDGQYFKKHFGGNE